MSLSSVRTTFLLLIPSLFLYSKWRRRAYPLPPGLKGWPIIGNSLDIPLVNVALVYASWAKKYDSRIVCASALGNTVVVVDSYDVAVELFDRRAAKYSSRPTVIMVRELMGYDYSFILEAYTTRWKNHRRRLVQFFRPDAPGSTTAHTPRLHESVNRLILDINETPTEFFELIRQSDDIPNIWPPHPVKPDPYSFNPDRFIRSKGQGEGVEINTSIRHPNKIAFGFGRRVCPGMHVAEQTLWLTTACLVTLFDLEAPVSEKANYIGPDGNIDPKFTVGFFCARKKFPCEFRVRSPNAAKLLAELGIGFQA